MKIAVVTCNTGKIDEIKGMPQQNIAVAYHCYHDGNLPYPLPNLSARMRARYIKTQMHRYIPGYDVYIWIDGRAEAISKDFSKEFTERLEGNDMVIFKHWERDSLYKEYHYIKDMIERGNPYIVARYADQQMEKEEKFCRKQGLKSDAPLYATTIWSRWNSEKVNAAMDEWWMRCVEFSHFDQAIFTYCAEKFNLNLNVLDLNDWDKTIRLNKHIAIK